MTSISFTSGEIMDIIAALEVKEDKSYLAGDVQLAAYYLQLVNQFQRINDRLSERPGEHRVAELVLAGMGHLRNWHTPPCKMPSDVLHYIRT
jgi:hypothetical protein